MAHPIWKDYILTILPNSNSIDFYILHNGERIYEGKAFARPTAGREIKIKINDICANYLRDEFPSLFPNSGNILNYIYEFEIYVAYSANNYEYFNKVSFYYDWSYKYSQAQRPILSAPILRKVPEGAPLIVSAIESIAINSEEYSVDEGYKRTVLYTPTADSVTITGVDNIALETYKVVPNCYRYMLYYLNAYGGWDFLLIEGKEKQTDNYTRHTIGQTYNNNQSRNRGARNYRNDIARKWQLHTLWIDDAGAQNMSHLLGSTEVYLYDIQAEELHPITLDNSQCEYKTYSNNGNQLVRYDIEATLAQNLTRK